jgi:3-oxoacyl-[acyl-carrier-protein] synthase-3
MDGPKIYKFVLRYFPSFVSRFLDKCEKYSLSDFDHVIPHQASNSALKLLRKRFGIPEKRFINNLRIRGNCMAASIPLALHESLVSGRIEKGADIAVVGTGAGISFGAMRIQLS